MPSIENLKMWWRGIKRGAAAPEKQLTPAGSSDLLFGHSAAWRRGGDSMANGRRREKAGGSSGGSGAAAISTWRRKA